MCCLRVPLGMPCMPLPNLALPCICRAILNDIMYLLMNDIKYLLMNDIIYPLMNDIKYHLMNGTMYVLKSVLKLVLMCSNVWYNVCF